MSTQKRKRYQKEGREDALEDVLSEFNVRYGYDERVEDVVRRVARKHGITLEHMETFNDSFQY